MTGAEGCGLIADLLPEFLAGRLPAEDDKRVRAHLEVCAECRHRANAVSLLQQTPVPVPDPDRWEYFVKGVVEETGRRKRLATPPRIVAIAALLAVIALAVFLWNLFVDPARSDAPGIEVLAGELAELPEDDLAAWTAGLNPTDFMPAGFDATGLSEEELEQLAREVGRT